MVNKLGSPAHPPALQQSAMIPTAIVPTAPRRRRGRGRPTAENAEDVRKKLLDAARELFPRYGYRGVSSRQIGAAAGVNFAMIRYYFGGKPGLYREMLQGVMQPAARKTLDAMTASQTPAQLEHVLENITRSWAANPWVAGFVVREVLAPDGPMRAMFLREFPERLAPVMERMVEGEIAAGKLRADLDPRLLVLSIVSLAVFPFLTLPLTTRVFGVRNDEEFVGRFLRHTAELLTRGVGPAVVSA
jgi:TetR/AcrR family transcriptional regulator